MTFLSHSVLLVRQRSDAVFILEVEFAHDYLYLLDIVIEVGFGLLDKKILVSNHGKLQK